MTANNEPIGMFSQYDVLDVGYVDYFIASKLTCDKSGGFLLQCEYRVIVKQTGVKMTLTESQLTSLSYGVNL